MKLFGIAFALFTIIFTALLLPSRSLLAALLWGVPLASGMAFAISGLNLTRIARRDRALIDRADLAALPKDGEVVAIRGTIEAEGETLQSPVRRSEALFYLYKVWHYERSKMVDSVGRHEVVDYGGWGATPCVVRGTNVSMRIGSFPIMHEFGDAVLQPDRFGENVKTLLANAEFSPLPNGEMLEHLNVMEERWDGASALTRNYRKGEGRPIEQCAFREQSVPPGAEVCALGVWSEQKQMLVSRGEQDLWLYPGSTERVSEVIASSGGCGLFGAVVMAVGVIGTLVYLMG